MHFKILFNHGDQTFTSQIVLNVVCPNNAHKNEALNAYISPRVKPQELCRLEIALKIT